MEGEVRMAGVPGLPLHHGHNQAAVTVEPGDILHLLGARVSYGMVCMGLVCNDIAKGTILRKVFQL